MGNYDSVKDPVVKEYLETFPVACDFAKPFFELGTRMYSMFRGRIPWQLEGTFSKIMLNVGHGLCMDRIPKYKANMLGGEEPLSLSAQDPEQEVHVEGAQAWLLNLLNDESKLDYYNAIDPTLQSVSVMGTGYRMPGIRSRMVNGKPEKYVTSKDVDFLQIIPYPNGGLVNPMNRYDDDAADGFFYVDWMTDDQILSYKAFPGFQKEEVRKLLTTPKDPGGGLEGMYQDLFNTVGGVQYATKNDWRERLRDITSKSGRRRVVHWWTRDRWVIIAQDNCKIYEAKNPLGGGLLPLAKYNAVPDFKNWFGISTLEMVEDMIIAIMMNFNYRFDYLARALFPAKYIREDVMNGKPESEFYDRPYAIHSVPRTVQRISDAVYYDRAPEITQQTFMEEERLKGFMQTISGFPDLAKGVSGASGPGSIGATGVVSMIRQAEGRLTAESSTLEYTGLRQEARLLLVLGDKFINDEQKIRVPKSGNGYPWSVVDPEAITDRYTIKTNGTRHMAQAETTFQKLLAMYPLWNGDPDFDQPELKKQAAQIANVLPDLKKALPPRAPNSIAGPQGAGGGALPQLGGAASSQDISQRFRGTSERNTVQSGGRLAPANKAI